MEDRNRYSVVSKRSWLDNWGSTMKKRCSSMMEDRNRYSVVSKRSWLDNWSWNSNRSSFNNGGSLNHRSCLYNRSRGISVRKTIVVTKWMGVSNNRVVINKGTVSLTMSSNTAVVVRISFGLSFSFTALTSNNRSRC